MKKIWFLILLALVFSWCTKPLPQVKIDSWSSIPMKTNQTWANVISIVQKIKEEIKPTIENKKLETWLNNYENKKWSFSLKFSPNRGFQENIWSSLVIFSRGWLSWSNQVSLSFSQLALADAEQNTSLEEYYNQNKLSIRDAITDFTEISQKKIKIDWNSALEVIYKWQQENQNFQIKQIFLQKLDKMFIITYLSSSSVFSQFLPELDDIIDSIKLN